LKEDKIKVWLAKAEKDDKLKNEFVIF